MKDRQAQKNYFDNYSFYFLSLHTLPTLPTLPTLWFFQQNPNYQLLALLNQGMKIKIEQSQIFVIQYFSNYQKIQIIPKISNAQLLIIHY